MRPANNIGEEHTEASQRYNKSYLKEGHSSKEKAPSVQITFGLS